MSAISLAGKVVFNHITTPDVYKGDTKYSLTIALDKKSKTIAEKAGLKTKDYEGKTQITSKRKVDFEPPKIYNADKELVTVNHLSLFGDKVTVLLQQGKGEQTAYTYLKCIRVDEKAEGQEDYDPSDF